MNWYPAIFLGGFGMMAAYWLTRSMRASEPVVGVTPTTLPARTAALCCGRDRAVRLRLPDPARVPAFPPGRRPGLRGVQPVGADRRPGRADRRPVARRPVARGRAGPLGAVPGRRVRAVPGHLRLGEPGDDPDPSRVRTRRPSRCCGCSRRSPSSRSPRTPASRPGAGRRGSSSAGSSPCARSRSWWRCCAGPRGRLRTRIIRALGIAGAAAVIMLVLASTGGFTHAVTA